ncbi:hypothetical protein Y032_0010g958 [Ancylostoma ceylanicum]|uniref:Uncharacterized protein n=1 Tax=Ancylostoma ceylanicum TaxID=53326 RepID=A0A016VH71_9BILA|nr:hypothetical protein Y032_0010g958 [Ancylostoma ceylanicum]
MYLRRHRYIVMTCLGFYQCRELLWRHTCPWRCKFDASHQNFTKFLRCLDAAKIATSYVSITAVAATPATPYLPGML